MRRSRYYAWAVLDVENWSSRSAVNEANIQAALRRIESRALASAGIESKHVVRQPRGDGAILALPSHVAKELITDQFVEALREAVLDHDATCSPEDSVRIRLSLHAGDVIEGEGEWAGQPVIIASRLVDSAVIKRVLAAAVGSPLAVIVSSDWYRAVIKEGHASSDGYQEVWVEEKTFTDAAWVKVPGRSRPPGLRPEDSAAPHHGDGGQHVPPPGEAQSYIDRSVHYGPHIQDATFNADVIFGDKYVETDRRSTRGEP
jgi:hypothetical protein